MFVTLLSLALAAQAAPQAVPAAGSDAKEKKICRSDVDTGTRINRRRTCATKQQWEERRQEQIDAMVQDRAAADRSRPCTSLPCP
nr:hypothetical protein [uncultured Sphingomonas sp.]